MRRIMRAAHLASASVVAFSSLLTLLLVPMANAATYTCTWTGTSGDGKFSTAGNWSGCNSAAPQATDTDNLVFDNSSLSADANVNNDITGLQVSAMTFSGSTKHGFSLSGAPFTLNGNITDSVASSFANIQNGIVLAGNTTVNVANTTGFLELNGTVSGTGNITKTGVGQLYFGYANTFTGSVTATAGTIVQGNTTAFGPASNAVTVNDGADLEVSCGPTNLANSLTLTGASHDPSSQNPSPKLFIATVCAGGAVPDESYGGFTSNSTLTISGNITLGSDVTFGSYDSNTTLTGVLSGNHNFTLPSNWGGQLTVQSSNNTSNMPNGTYKPATATQTLSDDQSSHSVGIYSNAVITIDGKRGTTDVSTGGVLKGTGTVGALLVESGATVAPGHSPGCLSTGNLTLTGTYQAEIAGTTPCTEYDQLKVTGTVDVTSGTLDVQRYNDFNGFKAGQSFTIIDNDGNDAVTGTFNGLPEGATVKLDNGTVLGITYKGGDGNDVVLSVKNVPTTPDTGFGRVAAHPAGVLAATIVSAGVLLGLAQRTRAFATIKRK